MGRMLVLLLLLLWATAALAQPGPGPAPVTGSGVDGGADSVVVTGSESIGNVVRLVKVASGWATGTLTLPPISTVSPDTCIRIEDGGGFIDGSHTLTVAANVADGINGGSTGGNVGPFTTSGTGLEFCVTATHNWNGGGSMDASTAPTNEFANGIGPNGLSYARPVVDNVSGWGTNVAAALKTALGSAGAFLINNVTGQSFTGGIIPTAFSNGTASSGTKTIDCGNGPIQTVTNGGTFTLAMATNDGSCVLRVTNNGSAGVITFSGFSEGMNTGDALTTTDTNKFDVSLTRIGGNPHYLISALQ